MSDDKTPEKPEEQNNNAAGDGSAESASQDSAQSGPTFTQSPDPLAGVKKSATDVLDSMEGKTVSMKVYVGSIIGVILLMLLARCGG
ncbi:MAG: hypothetical protein QNJ05_03320 [Woeseiaceae bacterium]|nr:hypothetical protein [Woeseiaceae bacterium]